MILCVLQAPDFLGPINYKSFLHYRGLMVYIMIGMSTQINFNGTIEFKIVLKFVQGHLEF